MQLALKIMPAWRQINPPLTARPKIDSLDRFRRRVHIDDKGTGTKTVATAVAFSVYNQSTGLIIWLCQPPTKHIKDEATGLNYMQARYYDPVMARFSEAQKTGRPTNPKPCRTRVCQHPSRAIGRQRGTIPSDSKYGPA